MFPGPIMFAAALIPLILGFIWYNPKVLGTAWMNASGMTEEKMKGANMIKIFVLTYIFSVMTCLILFQLGVHQSGFFSLFAKGVEGFDPGNHDAPVMQELHNILKNNSVLDVDNAFRTFGHGALHGIMTSIFFVLPLIAINAMFERKTWKYIMINTGYWLVSFALMSGLLCAFG